MIWVAHSNSNDGTPCTPSRTVVQTCECVCLKVIAATGHHFQPALLSHRSELYDAINAWFLFCRRQQGVRAVEIRHGWRNKY